VMPGGLARVSCSADSKVVTMQKGGGSKDTWVLGDHPVGTFSLLPPPHRPLRLSRAGGDLSSRQADNFYWLGRYVERAESVVRLLRGILVRLTEKSGMADVPELNIAFIDTGATPTGLGEPPVTVVAPAIGNAIFNAVGVRMRHLPIRPAAVLAALRATKT